MDNIPSADQSTIDGILRFLKESVAYAKANGVVLGLSGGLDSAVASKLAVMALGAEKVLNIYMPVESTPVSELVAATQFSDSIGAEFKAFSVQPVIESFTTAMNSDGESPLDMGNLASRSRMAILYNFARKRNYLVVGTSNRSEMMMGYFTKFGDGACDIMPLADLFKTQVREIASIIGIPQEIISKPPSAGFWEGQTDEGELNISYDDLDRILFLYVSASSVSEISSATGISVPEVQRLLEIVDKSEHKRHPPARPVFEKQ